MVKYVALDTECTGLDHYHGAKPYFVTTCDEGGDIRYWEWDVDPLNRQPAVIKDNLDEIQQLIYDESIHLVLHNAKYDVAALKTVIPDLKWPWHRTHDTLRLAHMLDSIMPRNLTDLAMYYLHYDILPLEKTAETYVKKARDYCRRREEFDTWRLADKGLEDMPSVGQMIWKADMWLPKALAPYHNPKDDPACSNPEHPFWHCLRDYANADTPATIGVFLVMMKEVEQKKLGKIYAEVSKVNRIAHEMEARGVSVNEEEHARLTCEYRKESQEAAQVCVDIAKRYDYDLKMPRGSSVNDSMREFVFEKMRLPVTKKTDKGNPSMDAAAMEQWLLELDPNSREYRFIHSLQAKRKRDKALESLANYERFWLPWENCDLEPLPCQPCEKWKLYGHWKRLHPQLNPTGTAHMRWSSSNPNEQNISKKEGFNLRRCFGPVPGREWWSLDAQNLELRIPAFEAGEEELMNIFLRPKDPPYFGSYHLAIFDLLHPELFRQHGKKCKELFESTWYQWVKNGNFSLLYGGGKRKVDLTFRVAGAYDMIWQRFSKFAALNKKQMDDAKNTGYVYTIPDRTVDPERGYPLAIEKDERRQPYPTKPLNYHTSGTACWWMDKAMIRVQDFFDHLNSGGRFKKDKWPGGYYLAMQVHDELVPDMPSGKGKGENDWDYNMPIVKEVKRLMELGGDDIGVPTPVTLEYNPINWSTGISL